MKITRSKIVSLMLIVMLIILLTILPTIWNIFAFNFVLVSGFIQVFFFLILALPFFHFIEIVLLTQKLE